MLQVKTPAMAFLGMGLGLLGIGRPEADKIICLVSIKK
jgi:hypothetical protein